MAKEHITNDVAMKQLETEFVPYEIALNMYRLGYDEDCLGFYYYMKMPMLTLCEPELYKKLEKHNLTLLKAPLWQQVARFLCNKSNNKIIIIIDGKDNYEDLYKKFKQAIEDFRNL